VYLTESIVLSHCVQIPVVVCQLKSLMQLFLRFNRIRCVDNEIRKLKVCLSSDYDIHFHAADVNLFNVLKMN